MNKKFKYIPLIIFVALAVFVVLDFQNLKDLLKSLTFSPTPEIVEVEKFLHLTPYGSRVFRASSPSLIKNHSEFESVCYADSDSSETSILGCFTDDTIYVYQVDSDELSGIIESTSAHELLHAVWARMDASARASLTPILTSVYDSADSSFISSLESYPDSQRLEEIYVRSATQIANLPPELESHFAKIFTDQDSVVAFYTDYITPFNNIKSRLDSLESELNSLNSEITSSTAEYESRTSAFSAEVDNFNSCASTPGCFSANTFNSRRAQLLSEQSSLDSLYESINLKITIYNQKVEEYNSNILHGKSLNQQLNPNKSKEQI